MHRFFRFCCSGFLILFAISCVPISEPTSALVEQGFSPSASSTEIIFEAPTVTEQIIPTETSTQETTGTSTQEMLPTPTSVIRTPIPDFTLTPTFTPVSWVDEGTNFPEAWIKINSPGHLSRVLSPFNLSADVIPGHNGQIRIELIGEDGRELMRQIEAPYNHYGRPHVNFIREIQFEIEGLVEYARLQISVDDEYGRTTHLSSVDLFLMSDGVAEVFPGSEHNEKIIIQHPVEGIAVYGNYLIITGLAKPADDKPLVVEIMSREGKYLATGMAPVIIPEGETWGLFAAEITLDLEEAQHVLVVVRERGSRIPGNAAISSVEVLLSP